MMLFWLNIFSLTLAVAIYLIGFYSGLFISGALASSAILIGTMFFAKDKRIQGACLLLGLASIWVLPQIMLFTTGVAFAIALFTFSKRNPIKYTGGALSFLCVFGLSAPLYPAGLIYISGYSFNDVRKQEAIFKKYEAEISKNARELFRNYEEGKVTMLHLDDESAKSRKTRNDKFGLWWLGRALQTQEFFAPEDVATKQYPRLSAHLEANRAVMFIDYLGMQERSEENKRDIAKAIGKKIEDLSSEDFMKALDREYQGITNVVCIVNKQGQVLDVNTVSPNLTAIDLRKMPGAEPLVEICQDIANEKPLPDLPKSFEELRKAAGIPDPFPKEAE